MTRRWTALAATLACACGTSLAAKTPLATHPLGSDTTVFEETGGRFNPRAGGPVRSGAVATVKGGAKVTLGPPPADPKADWLVVIRR